MEDLVEFLEEYSFDHAFLGSLLIEFEEEKAVRQLIMALSAGAVEIFYADDVGRGQRKRLKDKTDSLPLLDNEGVDSDVIGVRLT